MSEKVIGGPAVVGAGLSAYLGVPVDTIYAWRSAGTGPPGASCGEAAAYRPQDVRDWVASLSTGVVA